MENQSPSDQEWNRIGTASSSASEPAATAGMMYRRLLMAQGPSSMMGSPTAGGLVASTASASPQSESPHIRRDRSSPAEARSQDQTAASRPSSIMANWPMYSVRKLGR